VKAVARGHTLAKIDAGHMAWCNSEDWTEKDGQFVKGLPKWISEDAFTKRPRKPAASAPALNIFRPEDYGIK
ncbi:MAG: hypothetical protein V4597_18105, partial [Pseudomonadota bacterium]